MERTKRKEPRAQAHQRCSAFVYLIHSPASGLFKIGTTKNIKTRFKDLRTGDPSLVLLAAISASSLFESWLHAQFQGCRVTGEWFKLSESAVQWVCSGSAAERFNEHGFRFRYADKTETN